MVRLILLAAMRFVLLSDAARSEETIQNGAYLAPGNSKAWFGPKPGGGRHGGPKLGGGMPLKPGNTNPASAKTVGPTFEKYEHLEEVGKGSFGTVYKATSKAHPEVTVALKVPNDLANSSAMAGDCGKMQALEQRIKSQPGNGHVIRCLENGKDYIALEWAGKQGDKAIRGKPLNQILQYFKQLMLALRALQAANPTFVHHDLKWDNVAIADDQCLRVIDLDAGIDGACLFQHQGVGTFPATAPPEYDKSSNVLAFECGLEECAGPYTPCPLAYSWDMYTAGAMAVDMCGLDLLAAVRHIVSNNKTKAFNLLVQETDEQNNFENDPEKELHELGLHIFLGTDWDRLNPNSWTAALVGEGAQEARHSFVDDVNYGFSDDEQGLLKTWRMSSSRVLAMAARVSDCAQLGEDILKKFDEMIDANPQSRPEPQQVLNVMSDVDTGCSLDKPKENQGNTILGTMLEKW
eukprot:CAMPEP_0172682372 /NCGR_PEP_ID=MMETSP1074-20121228/18125_1 /TAXON_ID=2916 /ORGANISM="Ceratium fusus, Strain PA161109" /LENGTH=462 /DNA_ID=CAMNT_0013501047 /DNA_START=68 /DNA_END=1453 /DNA_ORIENTATION=+